MTHSLEELKRQMVAADDAAKTATQKAREARHRYKSAQFEATGFSGRIAEVTKWGKTTRFLPKKMGRWEHITEIEGPIIKKDGTPGERMFTALLSDAKDVGPYQHETPTAPDTESSNA